MAAIGGLEFLLALGHGLAKRLFDHSDERVLDRLRGETDPRDGDEAEEDERREDE